FAAALLLAFLRPVLPRFGSLADRKTERTMLVVIDHSLSMEQQSGGLTARQRAMSEADKILSTLGAEDSANVLLAGSTPSTCFFDLSRQIGEARRFAQEIKPGWTRADFTQ